MPDSWPAIGVLKGWSAAAPPDRLRRLAPRAYLPLQHRRPYIGINAEFIVFCDLWRHDLEGYPSGHVEEAMPICRDIRAITRGAVQARPGAVLILGGLLLLSVPWGP
jgi:hypothetical protein